MFQKVFTGFKHFFMGWWRFLPAKNGDITFNDSCFVVSQEFTEETRFFPFQGLGPGKHLRVVVGFLQVSDF